MCGPCRDRTDEEGPDAVAHAPALPTGDGFKPWAAGVSPDGALAAAGVESLRDGSSTKASADAGVPSESQGRGGSPSSSPGASHHEISAEVVVR